MERILSDLSLTGLDLPSRKRLSSDRSFAESHRAVLENNLQAAFVERFDHPFVVEVDIDEETNLTDRFRVIVRDLGAPYFYVCLDYGVVGKDARRLNRHYTYKKE